MSLPWSSCFLFFFLFFFRAQQLEGKKQQKRELDRKVFTRLNDDERLLNEWTPVPRLLFFVCAALCFFFFFVI